MTGQKFGKYKVVCAYTGQYVWLKAVSKSNALRQYARKYHNVRPENLFIGRPDLVNYTLHHYRRGKIFEPFAKVMVN